jgi:hypothetical protein
MMKLRRSLIGSALALACSALALAQTPSANVTIRGVLVDQNKKPIPVDPLTGVLGIVALPVEKDTADGSKLTITTELLNKAAKPNASGHFSLTVARSAFAGKKLMIVGLFAAAGMQPLKIDGKNIALDIDAKTTLVNLGTIVFRK